jgi:Icc protein
MTRIAWLTDIHLNFVEPAGVDAFLAQVRATDADAVLIGGDISEAHNVIRYLSRIDDALQRPVYFVLGNHDFYFGSIRKVRQQVIDLCAERPRLHYLTASEPIELAPTVGLVGHDGWADARIGDYERSFVMMNDYKLISELSGMTKEARWPLLKSLGDEAAAHIRRVLPLALERYPHVYLVTHIPPLREACWHEGHHSDDEWAPHFTCKAVGDEALEIMSRFPDRQLTLLCGHTHSPGETQPLDNVHIYTGGAVYGTPAIARVFSIV